MNLFKDYKFLLVILLFLFPGFVNGESDRYSTYSTSFKQCEEAILLPVNIREKTYSFLFDTGATLTAVAKTIEPHLGIPISMQQTATTSSGSMTVPLYNPIDIKLGNFNLKTNHPIMMLDLDFLGKALGCKFDGMMAMNFIHKHGWILDFEERKIELFQPGFPIEHDKYDAVVDLIPTPVGVGAIVVEMGKEKLPFIIDTGDTGSGRVTTDLLELLIEKNFVSDISSDDSVGASGIYSQRRARVGSFKIGSLQYSGLLMSESRQNALGLGFLRRHRVILDYPNKKLYLKKGFLSFVPDRQDKSGLKLINDNGELVIALIDDRGPASEAGIQKGDIIKKVNDNVVSGFDLSNIRKLLQGDDGEKITVTISRGEDTLHKHFFLKKGYNHI